MELADDKLGLTETEILQRFLLDRVLIAEILLALVLSLISVGEDNYVLLINQQVEIEMGYIYTQARNYCVLVCAWQYLK